MMSGCLEGINMQVLQKGLDAVWMRQQVISNNIANSQTAGYKSKTVEFESMLQDVLKGNYNDADLINEAIENINPVIKTKIDSSIREDGNNVDLDSENIELARAQLQYDYLVKSLTSQVSRLRYAINGGR